MVDAFEAWLLRLGGACSGRWTTSTCWRITPTAVVCTSRQRGTRRRRGLMWTPCTDSCCAACARTSRRPGALVVPETVLGAALRVPSEVHRLLRVVVYAVDQTGRLRPVG